MTSEEANVLLEKLINGELEEIFINQADFLTFREELVNHPNKKDFMGIAQRGGDVIYKYKPGWTA